MASVWIRTGKDSTFVSHGYEDARSALRNLEGDIKIRRGLGERWDKITKYHYVREDGLTMQVVFK